MAEIGPNPFIAHVFRFARPVTCALLPQELERFSLFLGRWHSPQGHGINPFDSLLRGAVLISQDAQRPQSRPERFHLPDAAVACDGPANCSDLFPHPREQRVGSTCGRHSRSPADEPVSSWTNEPLFDTRLRASPEAPDGWAAGQAFQNH